MFPWLALMCHKQSTAAGRVGKSQRAHDSGSPPQVHACDAWARCALPTLHTTGCQKTLVKQSSLFAFLYRAVTSAGLVFASLSALAATPQAFDGIWRITRPCDGATSQHFDRCRNNDAYLVTTQLVLQREGDTICGEVDQIMSPLRSGGGFVWGKVYGDVAHVYFTNTGWNENDGVPGEATLRMRGDKLDMRVTREAAGKWSVDSAFGLVPLPRARYRLEVWCPTQLGSEVTSALIDKAVEIKWLRYPKIPKRARTTESSSGAPRAASSAQPKVQTKTPNAAASEAKQRK